MAEVVEEVHLNSENHRTEKTKAALEKYYPLEEAFRKGLWIKEVPFYTYYIQRILPRYRYPLFHPRARKLAQFLVWKSKPK